MTIEDATSTTHVPDVQPGGPPATARHGTTAFVVDVLRRYWATTLVVLGVIVAGLSTGALWRNVDEGSDLYDSVAYGLPALRDGHVWTFVTGMFFAPQLALYVPILLLLVFVCSVYERRVGNVRALVVAVGGQALAALLTALFLWMFVDSGWTWAVTLGGQLDLGISAGGFALIGALSAVMQPVWRTRVRIGFGAYLGAMLLNSGLLWDVEHFVALLLGIAAGPFLAGRLPMRPRVRFDRRSQRALLGLIVALSAISSLVEGVFPGNGGPFAGSQTATEHPGGVSLGLVVFSLLFLAAADGLRRGRRVAWAFTTVLMGLAFVVVITSPPSAERTADLVLTGGQLVLLLATFRAFGARSHRRSFRNAGRRLFWVAVGLFAYTSIGFAILQDDFTPPARPADMIAEFVSRMVFTTSGNITPDSTAAKVFVRSIGLVWGLALLITIIGLIYSSRRPRPEPDQDTRLRGLLRQHGSSNIEWMLTWKGITVWFADDGNTAIGFEVVGSVALVLADPVGPLEQREAALRAFDSYCFERGWIPCLFAAGQASADIAPRIGWKSVEVAEDSVMRLEHLEFKGKAWQDVRTAINRAGKQDVELVVTSWAESKPVVTDQLRAISGGWVSDKALPEMGFTLGTLREADDPDVRLHLAVDADQTIEGFTSWMPVGEGGQVVGWTLDLMRRRDHGFRPVMEFMIGASALRFKEEGYGFLSLSAAPLAKAPDELGGNSDQQVLQRLLDFLGTTLEPYYGFQSLFAFKQKFQPEHHPMYLVFPDSTALAEIGIAVARAYMPDAGLWDWITMTWDMVVPHRDHEAADDHA
ncbi:MAG: phosphatidylglycerol lysyltransferase domain-containing protein [Ilumatobacteraceae bacterium]